MYKRINGKIQAYLIDFDLASLADRDSHNLDRTGTMPFMALELLHSVAPGHAPVLHAYAHDAEAVCWVVLWLGVQYTDGSRARHSFEDWEMVDAVTCYKNKFYIIFDLHQHLFTEPNKLLQKPIWKLLANFRKHFMQKLSPEGEVPIPNIDEWMAECDKEIQAQVSCIS